MDGVHYHTLEQASQPFIDGAIQLLSKIWLVQLGNPFTFPDVRQWVR